MIFSFRSSRFLSLVFAPTASILATTVGCLLLSGCGGGTNSKGPATAKSDTAAAEDSTTLGLLTSATDIMDVRTLGMSTEPDQAISLFNSALGQSESAKEHRATALKSGEAVWTRLLSESDRESVLNEVFTGRDGNHIWDALLSQQISQISGGAGKTELDRVVNAFSFVVRNLPLTARHPNDLPLTLHEIWTMGRGTTQDRAWAFTAILRQLSIDSVLLFAPDGDGTSNDFLVAVLLGDGVYLFDPRLGLPVPGPDSGKPATLTEVTADPGLLAQLSLDDEHPHPLLGGALNQPLVKLIGNNSFWAPRMRELEDAFVGDRNVRLYDPLQDDEGRPGYVSRVADVGGDHWTAQSLSLWGYPESQLGGQEEMSTAQLDALRTLKDSWKASWQGTFDPPGQDGVFSASSRSQFAARTNHLIGEFTNAKKLYVQIGIANRQFERLQQGDVSPALFPKETGVEKFNENANAEQQRDEQTIADYSQFLKLAPLGKQQITEGLLERHRDNIRQHRFAARDAAYWTGVCHYESGNHTTSRETFLRYLKNHPTGPWATGCRQFIALGHAAAGDHKTAAETLAGTPKTDPAYDGHQIQSRLWQNAQTEQ